MKILEDWLFNLSHKAVAMNFGLDGAEHLHEPLRVDGPWLVGQPQSLSSL